jgi:succinate-acetate transporter protein
MLVLVISQSYWGELRAIEISNSNTAFLLLFMGLLCVVFLICSLRTDVVHVVIFLSLVVAFGLLTGQHFQIAIGNAHLAAGLQIVCSSQPTVLGTYH